MRRVLYARSKAHGVSVPLVQNKKGVDKYDELWHKLIYLPVGI
jgi:hypothetical protein